MTAGAAGVDCPWAFAFAFAAALVALFPLAACPLAGDPLAGDPLAGNIAGFWFVVAGGVTEAQGALGAG